MYDFDQRFGDIIKSYMVAFLWNTLKSVNSFPMTVLTYFLKKKHLTSQILSVSHVLLTLAMHVQYSWHREKKVNRRQGTEIKVGTKLPVFLSCGCIKQRKSILFGRLLTLFMKLLVTV